MKWTFLTLMLVGMLFVIGCGEQPPSFQEGNYKVSLNEEKNTCPSELNKSLSGLWSTSMDWKIFYMEGKYYLSSSKRMLMTGREDGVSQLFSDVYSSTGNNCTTSVNTEIRVKSKSDKVLDIVMEIAFKLTCQSSDSVNCSVRIAGEGSQNKE